VKTCYAADLFCGAGGTSAGLLAACQAMGIDLNLIAINHWPVAVATHQANHEYAKHLCESIDNVDPRKLVPGGRLNVLVASPECTHHSNARGGKPMSDQSRSSAWHILRWAEALYIESILIENVKEFRSWGPLGATGRPIKRLRGQLFLNFLDALRALGYKVEDRVLNAANYGDPTTRERLFIIARRGNRQIVWPVSTHASGAKLAAGRQGEMFTGNKKPWRTAREIIDWQIAGKSIFARKKPLAPKTLARIAAGIKKFCGDYAEPFLVLLYGTNDARSIDRPLPTVTGAGQHIGLCHPFLIGQQSGATPRSVDEPVPTIATGGAISVIEPFVAMLYGKSKVRSIDEPAPTVTSGPGHIALVEPFIIGAGGPERAGRPRGVDAPLGTVLTKNSSALIEPFLINIDHQSSGDSIRAIDEPVPTVTTKARTCVVEPFMVEVNHGNGTSEKNPDWRRAVSVDEPMPSVTTKRGRGLVQPFVVKYNGTAGAQSVEEPLDTVSTRDRFGLVETEAGTFKLDIRFRMLEPHELAAAQGLAGYIFTGKKTEIVKQIGNAVPKGTATALCRELLA
jgi:DNA (cytosine-5)-methyltransferase 1